MTTDMGPPPPRNPSPTATTSTSTSDQSPPAETITTTNMPDETKKTLMPPPPPIQLPKNTEPDKSVQPNEPQPPENASTDPPGNSTTGEDASLLESKKKVQKPSGNAGGGGVAVPYTIPSWSEPPCHNYFLEVLKDGSIIDQLDVHEKGAYMFGRVELCDFILEHPTISRFHAVLQFNKSGGAFIYDLSSTHGTFINKNQVKKKVYVELHVGDVLRFGHSSRLYIFQGPSDLMPPEKDLKSIRNIKMRDERRDMEASLLRAKREAALADGISWGMDEDAVEEDEDDLDEITWQTFKGQLTEKQEKTREKVLKRLEKIANMKKEIDAIRAKDIAQGGLTQGQQTQIARNEQRMAQVAEELENLEETLNDSIRESLGARVGRVHGKKKGATADDEDEYVSDEDDFYDRTKKKPSKQKGTDGKSSVETADSLIEKKDAINKQIEEKKKLLADEKNKVVPTNDDVAETGDELDAFMSGLSSQLVHDKTKSIQNELDELHSELERVLYLLKIADPTGEASRKRESVKPDDILKTPVVKTAPVEKAKKNVQKQAADGATKASKKEESPEVAVTNATEPKPVVVYTVTKPQWLGAVETKETKKAEETPSVAVEPEPESDGFVDYKDRKEVLVNNTSDLESAAPGLIIRKRKQVEEKDKVKTVNSEPVESPVVDIAAEDAVALLLKHTRGIQDEEMQSSEAENGKKKAKKAKKVLGPERPSFLDSETDYETWVPPKGQSGDGRTSLNDRLGY
ncbi:putative forkhead-associated (FHA) domain, SMAD/FHA domain superfamily [Helianthus annuus]|uniref:Forkhead-associated (FHA) domain, SMAD/FHA domain superfamily n=1 Tax=Helianthus annuus TaxID=4232 RepID=A0A251T4H5_HELAN|nr:kanadaptin [Helianthus annuus]KAF5779453.1 putative forkhead-associated (FHA) domain, SMAD/FHA domain superfamily [Helianthus annuus]KAJ0490708.1 putative transcription factor interactor and regulator FHA-SMAD family [Helianthus annuus]KAJ0506629.1 putative transcription factor interactor and regulator FHA-SMAD family [Helianthus annuus]KAJ0676304.1 putative transcription factor interactor and regulator FHA-SMAD family [Helianthus annuus]KAJ0864187.1 putative transcription factor interactor